MNNKDSSDSFTSNQVADEWFLYSADALLLAFALMIGWYNLANWSLVPPHEPVSGLFLCTVFWIVGGLCVAVTVICLAARSYSLRLLLLVWLAVMFEVYQGGLFCTGSHSMHACFGSFSALYGVPRLLLEVLVQGVFIYFLAGGVWFALRSRAGARKPAVQASSSERMKTACPACGGHVQFTAANLGQTIACPHCQKALMLRKDQNLKMACFFCKEHIEFPAHAVGTKMECPHCKMDITLKESSAI